MSENGASVQDAREAVLLITCLRGHPVLVPPDTNWAALIELATEHGILPMVHQSLVNNSSEVPGFVAVAVQKLSEKSEMLARELQTLLAQFAEQDIQVIPLKGPALAATLYGDATMRPCHDLDMLVRQNDFQRAQDLLFELGFVARGAADEYHRGFRRDDLLVELHFGIASPSTFPLDSFPFDLDGVWRRSRPGSFRQRPMRIISHDDLVLYLCLHGLKHGFGKLMWVVDIARALGLMDESAFPDLMRAAKQQDLELALLIGCEAVREILQQLPSKLEVEIAESPEVAKMAQRAVERLFAEGPGVSNDAEIRSFYLQTERNRYRRWRRRLSFFAPTPEDYAWARRHRINRGLAPVLRPFRLMQKYGPTRMWRILFPASM